MFAMCCIKVDEEAPFRIVGNLLPGIWSPEILIKNINLSGSLLFSENHFRIPYKKFPSDFFYSFPHLSDKAIIHRFF